MNNKIKLSKSIVGEKEKQAIATVIDEAYLGMGHFVQDFENKLKEYLNIKHVVCVNTGTAALHLAVMSAGLKPRDEVLVQSLTFVSCFQAITAAGMVPVACEVLPQTGIIDLKDAEKRITKRTKAIMPIHYMGGVGDLDAIYAFARKHNLRVIEDASHAFGTVYNGKKIGSFGDIICFSFDGIKNITTGEGGIVVTNDDAVAEFIKDARLLGVQKDTEKRYQGARSWEFDVVHQGYRYHMSNIFAAIGLVQLGRLESEFKPARQKLASKYDASLKDCDGIELFEQDYSKVVPHIYVIKVKDGLRDALRDHLLQDNIETGIHYYPNHLLTFFSENKISLPVTEKVYSQILTIPLHPAVTDTDQDRVIKSILGFFNDKNRRSL